MLFVIFPVRLLFPTSTCFFTFLQFLAITKPDFSCS
nr:MAG TPA: hypothetical protein [Caudoviricetes sp.]